MGRYRHLSIEEREEIMCMRRGNRSVCEIARALGRAPSTISRELARNSCERFYRASTAQGRYEVRRLACRRPHLLEDPSLRELVQGKILEEQWSPDQIAGRLGAELGTRSVSRATIYREISARRLDTPELSGTARGIAGKLRRKGKRRRPRAKERRGKIKASHELAERPKEADLRSRLGDWEGDTVAGRQGGACLFTCVDRRSGYLVASKALRKASTNVRDAMVRALGNEVLETLTLDRGKEFSLHAEVTKKIGVEVYFCLPSHPWQRGSNENTNGLLREYFPKGCDLSSVTEEDLQAVCDKLNMRPRKRLGYRTPYEVYHGESLHLL